MSGSREETGLSRRAVLAAAPLAALLPFLPAGTASAAAPSAFAALVQSVLVHGDSAAEIGALFLKIRPAERDTATLSAMLRAALTVPKVASADIGRAMFRDAVRSAARRDVRRGEVVALGGAALSLTEARLCALVALTRPKAVV